MKLNALTAVAPVDGRYREKIINLSGYFSEYALIKYRLKVEIEYFVALCELPLPQLSTINNPVIFDSLRSVYRNFTLENAECIKEIERTTNHDVKAVEYYLKTIFSQKNLEQYKEFIHFGLTSQDINNTAVPLSINDAIKDEYLPQVKRLVETLNGNARQWKDIPMLAKTHGQPASPTKLGKEIKVFAYRLEKQVNSLENIALSAKFGGATGNLNAHYLAYPNIDWVEFANNFVAEKLGLQREQFTTQISNYDTLAALFDAMKRINIILIDLCRDMWLYISMEYFKQEIKAGEVGSSAMPHKVNPIDFENAEGNLGMANAVLEHLSAKLPISRLQRDLTDSTVLRNAGVPFAHTLIAIQSLQKGLGKLLLNREAIDRDLNNAWAVVAEGIQTVLRREGYPEPYEALKALTRRNEHITEQSIQRFIDSLNVNEAIKHELKSINPNNYTGVFPIDN
ncbi:MAG: adenylosuccinate lyase [Dysgonamonadaceae bacterium]|jgi:adenylosuccinate lyase|nr:adenylosuccinate lyase [Dysgonamonadaceae bacterium]